MNTSVISIPEKANKPVAEQSNLTGHSIIDRIVSILRQQNLENEQEIAEKKILPLQTGLC